MTHLEFLEYNYVPTEWICALMLSLFALSGSTFWLPAALTTSHLTVTVVHIGQAFYYKLWFLFPTVILANLTEVIGWSGRLWSSKAPYILEPFLMQCVSHPFKRSAFL